MKVENMKSARGNTIPNQLKIFDDDGTEYFQSYEYIIAKRKTNGTLYLDHYYWNYSSTTSTYLNQFTGMSAKETKHAINEGVIKLVNLN